MSKNANLRHLYLAIFIAVVSVTGYARTLPHVQLVKRYVQAQQYEHVLEGCKTRPVFAPVSVAGPETECWAATTAAKLEKEPPSVVSLVLNDGLLAAVLSRCKALSTEQRFKSAECAAAGRADTFISLRLPRAIETLKPLTFK
jgi:hypothetical protein